MLKSTKNLRKLKPGFCFAINREGFISVETWNDKSIEAFLADFADCLTGKTLVIEETDVVEQWG